MLGGSKELNFNINGVSLQVRTSHKSIFREFSSKLHYFKDSKADSPDIRMIIEDFEPPTLPKVGRNMRGDEKTLFWNPAPKLKFLLHDLTGKTEIRMTGLFRRVLSDYLIPVLRIKLLQSGYTILHAGCVSKNDKPILLSGFGGAGKSTLVALFLSEGYDYLGEDLVIVGEEKIYPFPTPIALHYSMIKQHYDLLPSQMKKARIKAIINAIIGKFIPKLTYPYVILDPRSVFGCSIPKSLNISGLRLLLLQKNVEEGIREIDVDEYVHKTLAQTYYWEDNMLRGLLQAYSFFDSDFDLEDVRNKEKILLNRVFKRAESCRVTSLSPEKLFAKLKEE